MSRKVPSALVWVDIETPCLPKGNDFSGVPVMEIAGVITDFDLMKFNGYHDTAKLTSEHATALKATPEVLQMHKDSGLILDCSKSDKTLRDLEEGMIELLNANSFEKGEYILAGSGVASFDFPLIKEKMPELASWFTYYTIDIGILRRAMYYASHGRTLVKPVKESFKEGYKKHRALDDVLAHIAEAGQYWDFFRSLKETD